MCYHEQSESYRVVPHTGRRHRVFQPTRQLHFFQLGQLSQLSDADRTN